MSRTGAVSQRQRGAAALPFIRVQTGVLCSGLPWEDYSK